MHSVFYAKSGVTGTEPELRPSASKTTASWIRRTTVSAADAVTRCCPLGPHTAEQRAGKPDLCFTELRHAPFHGGFLGVGGVGGEWIWSREIGEVRNPRPVLGRRPPSPSARTVASRTGSPAARPAAGGPAKAGSPRVRGLGGSDLSPAARQPSARCGLGSTARRSKAGDAATGGAPA
jgi:hypothetical protein